MMTVKGQAPYKAKHVSEGLHVNCMEEFPVVSVARARTQMGTIRSFLH